MNKKTDQEQNIKLSKKEIISYGIISLIMFSLSCIIGGYYVGYILIYLFLLWIAILVLSRSNSEVLDKIGNFTLMVLMISPVFVYLVILVLDMTITRFPSILYVEGSRNTWIGFSGSIIGGSMTMFALIFAIQNEDKKRRIDKREDLANSLLPIVKCKSMFGRIKTSEIQKIVQFEIHSISANNVKNLKVMDFEVEFLSIDENENVKSIYKIPKPSNEYLYVDNLMPAGGISQFFPIIAEPHYEYRDILSTHVRISIQFEYNDALDLKTYQDKYQCEYIIQEKDNHATYAPFDGKYKKVTYKEYLLKYERNDISQKTVVDIESN